MSDPGGFIEMTPAEVEQAGRRLGRRARELADIWGNHEPALTDLEGAIGNDVLGTAFHSVYDQESLAARGAARTASERMLRDSDIAQTSAALYTEADHQAAAEVRRTQPAGPDPT